MSKGRLFVLTGPTATGKSELGVRLAKTLDGEIVSADSMQIYKHMDIGTAKPTEAEMQGISHHMLDIVMPNEDYSVARYVRDATACIEDILSRGRAVIIVGGTGLYIDALLKGHGFEKRGCSEIRDKLEKRYDLISADEMLKELGKFDPKSASMLSPADKKRVVRAFEVYEVTGKTISEHNERTAALPPRYTAKKYVLNYANRSDLYDSTDKRVDNMISSGLEREVSALLEMGVSGKSTAMQAIGYRQMLPVILGRCTIDFAIDEIKKETRRYAKRQLTWLRRDGSATWIQWVDKPDYDMAIDIITDSCNLTLLSAERSIFVEAK